MRLVLTIDGELLVSKNDTAGMSEHKAVIAATVEAIGNLLRREDEMVICHGNASQVGTMLMRSEATRHLIYSLPLDMCGADIQGEIGYLLQQSLQNWFERHAIRREVVTLITQVVVQEQDAGVTPTKKGIGPFFDWELSQAHQITNGWEMAMTPGFGYQRVVPLLMPKQIVEVQAIRQLMELGVIPICAGGGGVPVYEEPVNTRTGVEAVVDKAYTSALLAREIQSEAILFITPQKDLLEVMAPYMDKPVLEIDLPGLDQLIKGSRLDAPIRHKLIASRDFLLSGGKSVLFASPEALDKLPEASFDGIFTSGQVLILDDRTRNEPLYKL